MPAPSRTTDRCAQLGVDVRAPPPTHHPFNRLHDKERNTVSAPWVRIKRTSRFRIFGRRQPTSRKCMPRRENFFKGCTVITAISHTFLHTMQSTESRLHIKKKQKNRDQSQAVQQITTIARYDGLSLSSRGGRPERDRNSQSVLSDL